MTDDVLFTVKDDIAHVILNRPHVLNALNAEMVKGMREVLSRIETEPSIRVVILKGAGGAFMAGGDINFFAENLALSPRERTELFRSFIDPVHDFMRRWRELPQPTIASVAGAAAGIGMSLMLACDLVIAADDSVFTLAYTQIGTSPDGSSTYSLPRNVGAKRAMEIALLGDRFDAKTALQWGLINWTVPAGDLGERTTALAQRLAQGPRKAYGAVKRLLRQSLDSSIEDQLEAEREFFANCAATEDFAEGVTAFLAKRKPHFTGK